MNIRKASPNDAQALSTLAMSLGKYYNDDDPSGISSFFQRVISVESFERYLENGEAYENYVYEEGGVIVGYVAMLNGTHFFLLFVDENEHKKGIARALVEYVLERRESKLYSVNASLSARPFYKKLGFVPSALVQKHHGMTYQPMVLDRV